jgi:hypothetical protein
MGICEGFGGFAGSEYMLILLHFGPLPLQDSHPGPDVDFTTRHFCCAEKNMSAVAACTVDPNRVLAAMGSGAVESNFSALVTVGRVDRPYSRVQSLFKAVRHLADGEGKESKSENGCVEEHFRRTKSTLETVQVFLLLAVRIQDGRVVTLYYRLQPSPSIRNRAVISALEYIIFRPYGRYVANDHHY